MQADLSSELQELQGIKEDTSDRLDDVFELLELGCNGGVDVVSRTIPERCNGRKFTEQLTRLPNGLPPIFPSNHQLDLEEYLIHPEKLPIHNFGESQRFWSRTQRPETLFNTTFSPALTDLKVKRDPKTGKLLGYHEVNVSNADCTGRNSTSLLRQPEPQTSDVKGNSTNIPFKPGGLDDCDEVDNNVHVKEDFSELDFEKDLLDIPPGFAQKISFKSEDTTDSGRQSNLLSIAEILTGKVDLDDELDEVDETERNLEESAANEENEDAGEDVAPAELHKSDSLENLLVKNDKEDGQERGDELVNSTVDDEDWAVIEKDPMNDFHTRVPDMAYTWEFKLDPFQKQAVVHLEHKESVFVAAHTSAGKTVVADYAIALSKKNMTKTIYTSPIKALSNQKFREFKEKFEDVGLITGDIQINPDANCIVMTTEILRSMLYRGSRLIRDTEWVIFDEVHYVNDAERGVVWEEVLIMLPDHVGVIMLSATVPNTEEFAGWVGRIKKKKIYVISTRKRPVELKYFLYTGNSSETSKEIFLIVDREGKFLPDGHRSALEAKSKRKKSKDNYGAKGARSNTSANEERNIWMSIIKKLEKEENLPVVAFTFSRKRCNDNAEKLTSLDLTTSKEKHEIHIFIQKCIAKLKDQDRQLPQVTRMKDLLKLGLAVHHSGILPILKEMIEMLFQAGFVKVLFATETFAMGVNMPARTVVFDSIRKHDGEKFRELLPGEFIQMAGRAGRRGKDKFGNVIILCKADVPEIADIQKMMMGKPTRLKSRFRLTYSMILSLLRSDLLCVEDMMKRSFAEFHLLKQAPERERMLSNMTEQLEQLEKLDCEKCKTDVEEYYDVCKELTALTKSLKLAIVSSPSGQKSLSPGRILIIKSKQFPTRYGVLLGKKSRYSSLDSVEAKHAKKTYTVLLPCDEEEIIWSEEQGSKDEEVTIEPYTDSLVMYCPRRPCAHTIGEVTEDEIIVITDEVISDVNSEAIMNDFNKRKQPRFRDDPPGKSISSAIEKLLRFSETRPEGLPMIDVSMKDFIFQEQRTRQRILESRIQSFRCSQCPSFEEHFKKYRKERGLVDNIASLEEKSSIEMLTLLPEYRKRIKVLIDLGYLNKNNMVEMKGRVACEISNHEIVISYLLYENFFNNFDPAEIVALLSCFVFEQKKCREPKLTERLKKGKERILEIAGIVAAKENDYGMDTSREEFLQQFKFGLVQVVYEWAKAKPFYEITNLTDVQEGIIVRCIQRLSELCSDVKNAAKHLGVADVQEKMDEASRLLKRDIVFAASLYTE